VLRFDFEATKAMVAPAWLSERAEKLGVEFEGKDVEQLGRYLAALVQANEQVNLTAITEPEAAWERHVLDSLTLMGVLSELPEGASVIDVGTGGGLPGIPLAICLPHLRFTLLEATGKKIEFLKSVVSWLGLSNVTVLSGRAEAIAHDRGERGASGRAGGHRERYDAVVARAVGRIAMLAELTVPLAKVGGVIAFIKGAKAQEELDEAKEALHLLKAVVTQTIPMPTATLVLMEKSSATPKTYPRADGEPSRAPLGVRAQRGGGGEQGGSGTRGAKSGGRR
jgi:16S rRNA (guanine527-N7)-methyltransferase